MSYAPPKDYYGADAVSVTLVDGEGRVFDFVTAVDVQARNDGAVLTVPSSLTVVEGAQVSLAGVSFEDVDADTDALNAYKVTFLALGGAFAACGGNLTSAPFLEVAGTAKEVNACLAKCAYAPYEGYGGAYVENVTVTLYDVDGGGVDTRHVPVAVVAADRAPQVVAPP